MDMKKIDVGILHLAAKHNFIELFLYILEDLNIPPKTLHPYIDAQNKAQRTPLMLAISKNHMQLTQLLINKGKCDYMKRTHTGTSLIMAVESNNLEMVKYIRGLDGVQVDQQDESGLTPIYVSCHNGSVEIVEYLLSQGANLNVRGPKDSTVLHTAAERDFYEIIKLILEKDPELIYEQDENGNTALHTAIVWSSMNVIQLMFSKGGEKLTRIKNFEAEDAVEIALSENQSEPYKYLCQQLGIKEQWTCYIF
eukprot:403346765